MKEVEEVKMSLCSPPEADEVDVGDNGEVGHPEGEVDETDLLAKAAQARVCQGGMVRDTGKVNGFTHLSNWTSLN